jgi:hypothetical protein
VRARHVATAGARATATNTRRGADRARDPDSSRDPDPDRDSDSSRDRDSDSSRDRDPSPDPLIARHFIPQNNVRLNAYKYGRASSSFSRSTSRYRATKRSNIGASIRFA